MPWGGPELGSGFWNRGGISGTGGCGIRGHIRNDCVSALSGRPYGRSPSRLNALLSTRLASSSEETDGEGEMMYDPGPGMFRTL